MIKKAEVFGPRDTASVHPDLLGFFYIWGQKHHICV